MSDSAAIPELPEELWPAWASTLRSQITGTITFDVSTLPDLLIAGREHKLPVSYTHLTLPTTPYV